VGTGSRPARRRKPAFLFLLSLTLQAAPTIQDCTHESQVLHETRHYRIFLPTAYESSTTRYPVIYWFHGYGERSNQAPANKDYDSGSDYKGDNLANFVASRDVIIVKPDGYNPRRPNENYPRPSHHAHLRPLGRLRSRTRIGQIRWQKSAKPAQPTP
jgi:poly(3-hydroxybutyrate) depolymerase